jgi:hypothetical protein
LTILDTAIIVVALVQRDRNVDVAVAKAFDTSIIPIHAEFVCDEATIVCLRCTGRNYEKVLSAIMYLIKRTLTSFDRMRTIASNKGCGGSE